MTTATLPLNSMATLLLTEQLDVTDSTDEQELWISSCWAADGTVLCCSAQGAMEWWDPRTDTTRRFHFSDATPMSHVVAFGTGATSMSLFVPAGSNELWLAPLPQDGSSTRNEADAAQIRQKSAYRTCPYLFASCSHALACIAADPAGRVVAAGCLDGTVRCWEEFRCHSPFCRSEVTT